jgi:hypothetical protein
MMPVSTSTAPKRMVRLTESIDAMDAPWLTYWRQASANATTKLRRADESEGDDEA